MQACTAFCGPVDCWCWANLWRDNHKPPVFPLMWAVDAATSFLRTAEEMRALVEATGFDMRAWSDVTPQPAPPQVATPIAPSRTIGISDIVNCVQNLCV